MLLSFLRMEFVLHNPWWLHFFKKKIKKSGEFLLHIPCWFHFYPRNSSYIPCWLHIYVGSFSYASRAGFIFYLFFIFLFYLGSFSYPVLAYVLWWGGGEFLLNIPCWLHLYAGLWLTHPVLVSFLCGEFLLQFRCYLNFCLKSFSCTSCAGFFFFFFFFFIWGICLTHPLLASFLS